MAHRRSGSPPLFTDPSANHARDAFRQKPRTLRDKLTTVPDAVGRLVDDGCYLAIGGFGVNRIPNAVVHEIVRQRKQNLSFAGHTATHNFQVLCAGNLTGRGRTIARVDVAYVVGLETRGLSAHARRVMESGEIESVEWSNYALAARLKAAAMGLSFLPVRSMLGTDIQAHSPAREITCPFTGDKFLALPALYPDVAAIHVHEADRFGNCRLRGPSVADLDLARAAKRLIVTCERLVPTETFRSDPTATAIPFYCVDAVCEVPFGSFPGNMAYEYYSDEEHLKSWLRAEQNPDDHRAFLEKYLFGPRDFADYLERCGGIRRLQQLRQEEFLLTRGR
jgi:glutaconate CoA-transferase subunit A